MPRPIAYVSGFLISLHSALTAYISSAFISTLVPEKMVGLVFAVASAFLILITFNEKYILARFGNTKTTSFLLFLLFAITLVLAWFNSGWLLLFAFIGCFALGAVIKFNLDLFLENLSTDKNTGKIRGLFLTAMNLAWLLSPLITTRLIGESQYWKAYLLSGLVLLPLLIIENWKIFRLKSNRQEKTYNLEPIRVTLVKLWQARSGREANLARILKIIFLLNFFFAVMVIYTSLYLLNHIGLSWLAIGKIFTVMLLPFVLIQYPLGQLADKYGEKEALFAGFLLMAGATASLLWIESKSLLVWAVVLFVTRVGAATIEIMSDSYLFKLINEKEVNLVALARNCYPFSYIVAPLLCSLVLLWLPLQYLFPLLGLTMLWGAWLSLDQKDTN